MARDREDDIFAMLEDFAKLSSEELDDIIVDGLAEEIEPFKGVVSTEEFTVHELDELESEDTRENDLSLDNPWGDDINDYMDKVFDDVDVSLDEVDFYGED